MLVQNAPLSLAASQTRSQLISDARQTDWCLQDSSSNTRRSVEAMAFLYNTKTRACTIDVIQDLCSAGSLEIGIKEDALFDQ